MTKKCKSCVWINTCKESDDRESFCEEREEYRRYQEEQDAYYADICEKGDPDWRHIYENMPMGVI